ncbi:MAG: type II secretion system F family protein [Patescibacteria group bacterium]|jgi:type IV pilus assembly protein PilC
MALFVYKARSAQGQLTKGVIEAPSLDVANEELRERQLIVIELAERSTITLAERWEQFSHRISVRDITFFARQLSVLINATVPVVRALKILTRQTENNFLKKIIADVASEVDGGAKLSTAMGKYPKVFDQFFTHMIRAGETTGRLDEVFEYLATQKEKDYALMSRVRGAMIYPAFIISVMLAVGVIMLIYVVPPITEIITQSGAKIPLPTQIMIGASYALQHFWWLILILVVGTVVGFRFFISTESGRYSVDYFKIKAPIIGPIYQRIVLGRFAISLSNLLSSGVPLPTALNIVADIVSNSVYKDLIIHTIKEVEAGNAISASFLKSTVIPPMVAQMMSVGEETGKLDAILMKLGNFYVQEVDTSLSNITSLIEPIIIITLGVGAFIMVYGILAPIYGATNTIS